MPTCERVQDALCRSLGAEYRTCYMGYERVIYRDFGNGFNVEISCTYTTNERKPAVIYLWFGTYYDSLVARTVRDVPREKIGDAVEELRAYSEDLIQRGLNNQDSLSRLRDEVPYTV